MVLLLPLTYILFFLLIILKIPLKDIENIIIIIGVLYVIVYAISVIVYPTVIFIPFSGTGIDRGFQRIFVRGIGFAVLLSFYALSQFQKRRKFKWLILFSFAASSIILVQTRTLLAGCFIFWALLIMRKSRSVNKIFVVLLIGLIFFGLTQMDFYQNLVHMTRLQTEGFHDDIRMISARFYLNDFSPGNFAKIFGNGIPNTETQYFYYVNNYLQGTLGLFTSDIGYIGLYTHFGLLALIAYAILIFRTIRVTIQEDNLYCKYFLYLVFTISIINDATFSLNFIPSIVLAAYIISLKSQDVK